MGPTIPIFALLKKRGKKNRKRKEKDRWKGEGDKGKEREMERGKRKRSKKNGKWNTYGNTYPSKNDTFILFNKILFPSNTFFTSCSTNSARVDVGLFWFVCLLFCYLFCYSVVLLFVILLYFSANLYLPFFRCFRSRI